MSRGPAPNEPAADQSGDGFPEGQSVLMLAAARLRHVAGTKWGRKKYMNMDRLWELEAETKPEVPGAMAG